jgi:iron-sulfur cluster assembly protein
MLELTETAAELVKTLTATPQAPEGSGLRITSAAADPGDPGDPGALRISAAAGPSENDQVIEAVGAHVYLEPQAAAFLEDKVLDAEIDADGQAHFSLGLQSRGSS